MLPRIWPPKRALLLFSLVTAAVVIGLVSAAGARADVFDDAQAALEQAAAQTGGAPSPVAPVKRAEPPKKSWDSSTGGVAAPADAPSNVNISIRVQSPGNDGPTIQQNKIGSSDELDQLQRNLEHELDVKLEALKKEVAQPPPAPKVVMPIRHVAAKPPPPLRTRHAAPKLAPAHIVHAAAPVNRVVASPPPRPRHRVHRAAPIHAKDPFKLPPPSENQAMSAGSSGGTSTPPPAPIAALLAAACLAASLLVTSFWDAHRRRRSRLFASRLERPG